MTDTCQECGDLVSEPGFCPDCEEEAATEAELKAEEDYAARMDDGAAKLWSWTK